jgi:prepilin-type N-terminal cleavage/methylation domain-containing protein
MITPHKPQHGFTLVELLVTVAIIVVLLALLATGIYKALYASELAACASTIKGMVTGGTTYAQDNRSSYPSRGEYGWDALFVKIYDINQRRVLYDLPKDLDKYVGIEHFLDPLSGKGRVDLRTGINGDPPPSLYSNYQVYFDWGHANQNIRSIKKIGDRMVFRPPDGGTLVPGVTGYDQGSEIRRFNVLIADLDERRNIKRTVWDPGALSSHPDDDGILTFGAFENEEPMIMQNIPLPIGKRSGSFWGSSTPNAQGPIKHRGLADYNYGLIDGSVIRLDKVEIDDERCAKLVMTSLEEYVEDDRKAQLPMGN